MRAVNMRSMQVVYILKRNPSQGLLLHAWVVELESKAPWNGYEKYNGDWKMGMAGIYILVWTGGGGRWRYLVWRACANILAVLFLRNSTFTTATVFPMRNALPSISISSCIILHL